MSVIITHLYILLTPVTNMYLLSEHVPHLACFVLITLLGVAIRDFILQVIIIKCPLHLNDMFINSNHRWNKRPVLNAPVAYRHARHNHAMLFDITRSRYSWSCTSLGRNAVWIPPTFHAFSCTHIKEVDRIRQGWFFPPDNVDTFIQLCFGFGPRILWIILLLLQPSN